MKIAYDYLAQIRRAIGIYTKQKTSSILEGDFTSRLHGKSMEFDDLREYLPGDDVNDIDWKSSSRTGKILIRRYQAQRRHNVMIVGDSGVKMTGDTPAGESKEDLALMCFGMTAFLVERQGADFAITYSGADSEMISPFRSGGNHLEALLYGYKKAIESGEPRHTLSEMLMRCADSTTKHMVMVVITDSEGLSSIDEKIIRRLVYRNDVVILNIEDAYLTTNDAYDLERSIFEDSFLTGSALLHQEEMSIRADMEAQAERVCTPHQVFFEKISRQEDIIEALMRLSNRRKGLMS